MMKTRRGWYLVDNKIDDEARRRKNEKEIQLQMKQTAMIKRCNDKIARRRLWTEQQKILEEEELSRAQETAGLKQRELEMTYRLAAELSRRKNEEAKHAVKLRGQKISMKLPSSCASEKARKCLIEKKVRLEATQAELSHSWHQDKAIQNMQKIEEEKKKRNLCVDLQNQLADNHQRVQEERMKEKDQDREMMEQSIRKIHEEDVKMRKQKKDNAIMLKSEMASLVAKKTWDKEYKKALKAEDERITCIIAEKATTQKKKIDVKTEFRVVKEAEIDKVARKLLEDVHKKREREKISNELYEEEQKSKWAKEPARLVLKKQCAVAKALREMEKQQKGLIERKTKDEADEAAFVRYLIKEHERDIEKQRKRDEARREKNIQYGEELKEAIMNNRISYAMNILERQSEICVWDQNINQLITIGKMRGLNDRRDNKKTEEIDTDVKGDKCSEQ